MSNPPASPPKYRATPSHLRSMQTQSSTPPPRGPQGALNIPRGVRKTAQRAPCSLRGYPLRGGSRRPPGSRGGPHVSQRPPGGVLDRPCRCAYPPRCSMRGLQIGGLMWRAGTEGLSPSRSMGGRMRSLGGTCGATRLGAGPATLAQARSSRWSSQVVRRER